MQDKNTDLSEIFNTFPYYLIPICIITLHKTHIYHIFDIMKRIALFFGIVTLLALSSCKKKEVTSCIELDNNAIATGQSITFTSCSENELSYYWTIEGPEDAPENTKVWNDRVITIPFTVTGAYTITLISYSKFSFLGDQATNSKTFTVN